MVDPRKVFEILREALSKSGPDRDAFVEAACGGDAGLQGEIRALLRSDERAEEEKFLSRPVAVLDTALRGSGTGFEAEDHVPRGPIGPYTALRIIGSGGMGVVYLAVREDLGSRVALKLAYRGSTSTETRRRFEQEQRVLARLDHPGIARLLDAGTTPDGVPFIAMELIDGKPISEYCSERHLPVADRLRLIVDVCDAVQYAHRNLVVHRDLKPSNILVRPDGAVKLLDFGIAKLLGASEDESLTLTGMRPMTPDYAAPEQIASGVVTTATDVYALGVLLFELVAGRRPFELGGRNASEVERIVCHEPPPRPSTVVEKARRESQAEGPLPKLERHLAGDLDTIVLKALAKEPEHRYPSVAELAADLGRFLEGRPVLARPQTWIYRSRRFVRRHRPTVLMAFSLAVVIPLLLAHEIRLRRTTEAALDLAAAEGLEAYQVAEFMTGLFSDPFRSEVTGADTVSALTLLTRASDRLLENRSADALTRAVLLRHVGRIYGDIGLHDRADTLLAESLSLFGSIGPVPTSEAAETSASLGLLRYLQRRTDEADSILSGAVGHLAQSGPGTPDLARAVTDLGLVRGTQGRWREADSLFRIAHDIWNRQESAFRTDLVLVRTYRADALAGLGEAGSAVDLFGQTIRMAEAQWGRLSPNTTRVYWRYVNTLIAAERYAQADSVLGVLVAIYEDLLGPDHEITWANRNQLKLALSRAGRHVEAEAISRSYLRYVESTDRSAPIVISGVRRNIADEVSRQGRHAEAEMLIRDAMRELEASMNGSSASYATMVLALGIVLERAGRPADALRAYEEAVGRRRVLSPRVPQMVAEAVGATARALQKLGRFEEAEARYLEALQALGDSASRYPAFDALIRLDYGTMLMQAGRTESARSEVDSARAFFLEYRYAYRRELARADSLTRARPP